MSEHGSEPRANDAPHSLDNTTPVHNTGPDQNSARKRRLLIGAIVVLVVVVIAAFATPRIRFALNTVSTDDAYVNGHVTFVAPRVAGQTSRVLVDDNNRVRKGDLLAELDKEPYQVAVAERQPRSLPRKRTCLRPPRRYARS